MSTRKKPNSQFIILVHGIRTFGKWQDTATELIKADAPEVKVIKYRLGLVDTFSFLLPPFRRRAIRAFSEYLSREEFFGATVSIVSHSYGTYVVGKTLKDAEPNTLPSIETILTCGSVLKTSFDWGSLIDQKKIKTIVNEAGGRDMWPLIAQLVSFGMGAAGRHGFNGGTGPDAGIINRHYPPCNHSGFFAESHMNANWLPALLHGDFDSQYNKTQTPGWITELEHLLDPIKLVALTIPLIIGINLYREARQQEASALVNASFEKLHKSPADALIHATAADNMRDLFGTRYDPESQRAVRQAYNAALLYWKNEQLAAEIVCGEIAYLGQCFTTGELVARNSYDGKYKLIVSQRGFGDNKPPGTVFLTDNETYKTIKLDSCHALDRGLYRAEFAVFSPDSKYVFVGRGHTLFTYSLRGKCLGSVAFGKSPIHIMMAAGKNIVVGDGKGGIWLARQGTDYSTLIGYEHAYDPAVFMRYSDSGQRGIVGFKSGDVLVIRFNGAKIDASRKSNYGHIRDAFFIENSEADLLSIHRNGAIKYWKHNGNSLVEQPVLDNHGIKVDGALPPLLGGFIVLVHRNLSISVLDYINNRLTYTAAAASENNLLDNRFSAFAPRSHPPIHCYETQCPDPGSQFSKHGGLYFYAGDSETKGSVFYQDGDELKLLMNEVEAIHTIRDRQYLQRSDGLFTHASNEILRITEPNLSIKKITIFDNKTWLLTDKGTFWLTSDNELLAVTGQSVSAVQLKKAGNHYWLFEEPESIIQCGQKVVRFDGRTSATETFEDIYDVVDYKGTALAYGKDQIIHFDGYNHASFQGVNGCVVYVGDEQDQLTAKTQCFGVCENNELILDIENYTVQTGQDVDESQPSRISHITDQHSDTSSEGRESLDSSRTLEYTETYRSGLVEQVTVLIAQVLGVTVDRVVLSARLGDDLGADSLDIVELIMYLEEMFDIEINDPECDGVETVADAISLIEKL